MDDLELQIGRPHGERADAARNRAHLLDTARELLAERGASTVTMDALAARAGLGKGTVFRRFGSRAGIFAALLDDEERSLQQAVLSGPPPLGPGAPAPERLLAYGSARIRFLVAHREVARASLDGGQTASGPAQSPLSRMHIRMLLGQIAPAVPDLDILAVQLTAALDAPLLLQLCGSEPDDDVAALHQERLIQGWRSLLGMIIQA